MSYAPKGNAPSECDPGWVRWAEGETVSRLQDQLTALRVQRELRRAAEPAAEPEPETSPPAPPSGSGNVTAMNAPPAPGDPAWQAWAEAQTVLRLRHPRPGADLPLPAVELPQPAPQPAPPSRDPLRVEVRPPRTIRIHHDNLEIVRLSESKESV